MNTFDENKLTYNGISFLRSNRLSVEEREIHSYHEILFCIDIQAVLFTEKTQKMLEGNVLLLIPRGTYHLIQVQNCASFPRMKIYFPEEAWESIPCRDLMSDICIMENVEGSLLDLLKNLCRFMEEPPCKKQGFYAYSTFFMLLTELDRCALRAGSLPNKTETMQSAQLVHYISQHLSETLTLKRLAKQMNLSLSSVTHVFKKEIGIPVHQYITQKRMILAQTLLKSGEKPSKIYTDCGYKDYSSFYKAYVTFFGYPPSAE